MKYVEFFKLQNDGSQTVIAVCKLVGEKVSCEGDSVFIENLENEGIWDNSTTPPTQIFPKDGIKFLERLQYTFASGYLNASEVKEG